MLIRCYGKLQKILNLLLKPTVSSRKMKVKSALICIFMHLIMCELLSFSDCSSKDEFFEFIILQRLLSVSGKRRMSQRSQNNIKV